MSFRPKAFTYVMSALSSATPYPWIPVDWRVTNFLLSYGVDKSGTGDVTYSVQGTLDNPFTTVSCVGFDLVSAKTVTFYGSQTSPITAIRLKPTATSGASTLALRLLESDRDR